MKHIPLPSLTLVGLGLLLAGCGSGGDDAATTSQLTLTLSDAPVDDAKQVCIAISALRLKAETEPDDHIWQPLDLLATDDNDGCLPTGYQIPLDDNGDPRFLYLDLLHYQDGQGHALLSGEAIPSGNYEQLRLMVEDGRSYFLDGLTDDFPSSYVVDESDNLLPLEVPSSEVKLHGFTASADGVLSYQLEFNLRHAMVLPGHSQYYKLKPNGVRLLDATTLASLTGQVDDSLCDGDLSQAGVYLYPARDGSELAYLGMAQDTDSGGPSLTTLLTPASDSEPASYRLDYIEPGSYDLQLVCNAASDAVPEEDESDSFVPVLGAGVLGITLSGGSQSVDLTP